MPVRVSYKKQFAVMTMLLLTFLIVLELGVNFWLYNIYRCDFENSEIFKNVDPEINRKMCLESIQCWRKIWNQYDKIIFHIVVGSFLRFSMEIKRKIRCKGFSSSCVFLWTGRIFYCCNSSARHQSHLYVDYLGLCSPYNCISWLLFVY